LRYRGSFRSATDYRSPINGLPEINGFELSINIASLRDFSDNFQPKVPERPVIDSVFLSPGVNTWARENGKHDCTH